MEHCALIYEARERDLAVCADVIIAADSAVCEKYGFEKNESSRAALERLKDDCFVGGHVFKLMERERVAATFTLRTVHHDKKLYELNKMAVRPEFQGRGYAARMLDYAGRFVSMQGGTAILCAVVSENERLISWLCKHGFWVEGIRYSSDACRQISVLEWCLPQQNAAGGCL